LLDSLEAIDRLTELLALSGVSDSEVACASGRARQLHGPKQRTWSHHAVEELVWRGVVCGNASHQGGFA
jgi:hypothetical protein